MARIKYLALLLTARAVKLARGLYHLLGRGMSWLGRPWRWLGRTLVRVVLLPPYVAAHRARWWLNRLNPAASLRRANASLNVAVAVAAGLALATVALAQPPDIANVETFGRSAIIDKLIAPTDDFGAAELIWEEGPLNLSASSTAPRAYYEERLALDAEAPTSATAATATAPQLALVTGNEDALLAPDVPPSGIRTRTEVETYTVESGDTVTSIARRYGLSVYTVLWANGLSERSVLKLGQALKVPPVNGVLHTVQRGDTLASIAKRYGADAEAIRDFNKLADAGLTTGGTVVVPGGQPPAAPRPVSTPATSIARASGAVPAAAAVSRATRLQWPTSSRRITQYYGWRHTGLDIGNRTGEPIYAAEDGTVVRSQWNNGYGYNVVLDHGGGLRTLYGHASKLLVTPGQKVKRGQVLALIGSTGRSTGPHLHFEVIVGGGKQNPLSYSR